MVPGSSPEGAGAAVPPAAEEEAGALLARHGRILIEVAALAIRHGLDHGQAPRLAADAFDIELSRPAATFVTLKREGRLRGCIGTLQPSRALIEDVAENAFRAAFRDPRFPPLARHETDGLDFSIALLSRAAPLPARSEAELVARLRPGVDGLIIRDGTARAVFLPAVWESLPVPRLFLAHLKKKAGLRADHWSAGFRAWRFTTHTLGAAEVVDPATLWTTH